MKLKLTQYPIAAVSTDLTLGKYYECEEVFYCDSIYNVFDDAGCRHEVEKVCFEDTEERTSEWNGEGYPPVGVPIMIRGTPSGCICEGVIDYIDKVHCIWHWNDGSKNTMYNRIVDMEFKPIKSEKDKEIEKIDDVIDEWQDELETMAEKSLAEYLYEKGLRFKDEN